MSNCRFLAIPITLAATIATAAGAQSPSPSSDSALREIRLLDSVMVVRARTVDSVRRALVRRAPPVELAAGSLRVRTDSALAPRVRQAVDAVARAIDDRKSTVIAGRLASRVPSVTRDSTRSLFGMTPTVAFNADTSGRWSPIGQRQVPRRASSTEMVDALATIVEQIAMQGSDSALAAWVMLGRVPVAAMSVSDAVDAYLELATTESVVLRRCRARDVAACLDALGLDSVPERRLARWYAPPDYRSLVRAAAPEREDSAAVTAWIRCRETGEDAACRRAAEALPDARVPLPLSGTARFAFLREVLDAGGPGAFDRLVRTPGALEARFTAAAGEPLDRTVLRWLDRVGRSRPERMRVRPTLVLASLGWTALILVLPLTRRSRWA